jgi:hypothetical protein
MSKHFSFLVLICATLLFGCEESSNLRCCRLIGNNDCDESTGSGMTIDTISGYQGVSCICENGPWESYISLNPTAFDGVQTWEQFAAVVEADSTLMFECD